MFFVAFQSSVSCYTNRKQNIEACHRYGTQSEFLLIFQPDPEGQLLIPQRNHILGLVPSYDLGVFSASNPGCVREERCYLEHPRL